MFARIAAYRKDLETLAAAAVGSTLFHALGVPAGALSGAMIGVVALIIAGRPVQLVHPLRDLGMLLCGVTMGAAVTPEMLKGFDRYPVSLAILAVSLAANMAVTGLFLRWAGGWDKATAFFAAAPGALSAVFSVAMNTRADLLRITMAQTLRLFMLVAVVPAIVVAAETPTFVASRGIASAWSLLATIGGSAIVGFALSRTRFAGPWIFGGMMVSAVLHGSGFVTGDPPDWLMRIGFMLVGIFISTRFTTITRKLLLANVAVSAGAFVVGLAVASIFATAAALSAGVPFGQALVAFAPGGLEAMIVLGAALGLDPIYVGLHHLVRFFGLGLLMPLSLRWIGRDQMK